jgi:hypothetical protein
VYHDLPLGARTPEMPWIGLKQCPRGRSRLTHGGQPAPCVRFARTPKSSSVKNHSAP